MSTVTTSETFNYQEWLGGIVETQIDKQNTTVGAVTLTYTKYPSVGIAISSGNKLSPIKMLLLAMFVTLAHAGYVSDPMDVSHYDNATQFDELSCVPDNARIDLNTSLPIVDKYEDIDMEKAADGDRFFVREHNAVIIVNDTVVQDDLVKRGCTAPVIRGFNRMQIAQDGYWWGPWRKANAPGLSCGGGTASLTSSWSRTDSLSWNSGFGASLSLLNLNLGTTYTTSRTVGGQITCNCDRSNTCVWVQQLVHWMDVQIQSCYQSACGVTCGPYSPYIHQDVYDGDQFSWNTNYGCSYGSGCN